jgi:elongator complex protein 3
MSSRHSQGKRPTFPSREEFDPAPYRADLRAIVGEIQSLPETDETIPTSVIEAILRRHPRDGRGFFSRAQLIAGIRDLRARGEIEVDEQVLISRLRMRPVRTQSGVTPVTVLTRPHPCPGRCVFCPNDVRMPKSYLADEPGAQRAAINHFDPYLQTWSRLETYRAIGHPVDKIELIVLGGTWSFHPEPYQLFFIKRCFDALNDFGNGVDRRSESSDLIRDFHGLRSEAGRSYNDIVGGHLRKIFSGSISSSEEDSGWPDLLDAQRANEDSNCRNVGLVIETRPDHLSIDEVIRIRRLGCTKVQIGYQSLSDPILALNRRGHDVASTRQAMLWLRAAGFKIHAHWMPNLLGATPDADRKDFEKVFSDPDFRPDELKIYPCSLIESAELMDFHRRGEWRPYSHEELLDVVVDVLARTPRYCRLTRVVRDFSSDDIVVGNKFTNFRQIAEAELKERGESCVDIRAREVRNMQIEPERLILRETLYPTSVGSECFLEFVDDEDRIAGFLRLTLPERPADIEELRGRALIREVHVYGVATELGSRQKNRTQHRGLGGKLMAAAAERAGAAGFEGMAVISAVGTRAWYRRLGFEDGELYQHRSLP